MGGSVRRGTLSHSAHGCGPRTWHHSTAAKPEVQLNKIPASTPRTCHSHKRQRKNHPDWRRHGSETSPGAPGWAPGRSTVRERFCHRCKRPAFWNYTVLMQDANVLGGLWDGCIWELCVLFFHFSE